MASDTLLPPLLWLEGTYVHQKVRKHHPLGDGCVVTPPPPFLSGFWGRTHTCTGSVSKAAKSKT